MIKDDEVKFTDEQHAVIHEIAHGSDPLIVDSVAGSGKTTTSEAGIKELHECKPFADIICVAFNKRIVDELAARMPASIECRTMNSIGHRAWMRYLDKKLQLDTKKIYRNVEDAYGERELPEQLEDVPKLVGLAKQVGIVPDEADRPGVYSVVEDTPDKWVDLIDHFDLFINDEHQDEAIRLARDVLHESIADSLEGVIDFSDQLYMPVCWNASFKRFNDVLIDEAQDISNINRIMLHRSLAPGGRLFAVGDPYQAIYGFRGAASDSMILIAEEFKCKTMQLTYSFRCGKEIIAEAQKVVPQIRAPDDAHQGVVESWREWPPEQLNEFVNGMVICRNTAPLVQMCFRSIRHGIPAYIVGRDIGKHLGRLVERLCSVNKPLKEFPKILDDWERNERAKAMLTGKEMKAELASDKAASIRAVIASLDDAVNATVGDLAQRVRDIFADPGNGNRRGITLSTIHKAKGLEAGTVGFLDPDLIPSKFARQAWQMDQEMNLRYVGVTRAIDKLVYLHSDDMER